MSWIRAKKRVRKVSWRSGRIREVTPKELEQMNVELDGIKTFGRVKVVEQKDLEVA